MFDVTIGDLQIAAAAIAVVALFVRWAQKRLYRLLKAPARLIETRFG